MSYETVMMLLLLLLVLLAGAFVICLLHQWFQSSSNGTPGQSPGRPEEGTSDRDGEKPQQDEAAPPTLSSPRAGGADDLQRINGIGRKLELKLNSLGIYHYDQIAGWDRRNMVWADTHLSFKGRVEREEWVFQANELAQGRPTAFSKTYDKKHAGQNAVHKVNQTTPDTAPLLAAENETPSSTQTSEPEKPVQARGLEAPIGGEADDLKITRGIGPSLEKTLNDLGVFHFGQIAVWSAEDVSEIGDLLSFKGRIEREQWIAQAKKLIDN